MIMVADAASSEGGPDNGIDELGKSLVFLVSMPRSGSTLLSAMLDRHPAVHCPSEPWLMLRLLYPALATLTDAPYDDTYARTALREVVDPELGRRGIRSHANAIYQGLLQRAGKQVLVDKTPRYYFIAKELLDLFPECRLILLKRDPLAVAASMKDVWGISIETLCGQGAASHRFDLTAGFRGLIDLEDLGSPRVYPIKYELLTMDLGGTLAGLCAFLDVPFEQSMEDFASSDLFRSLGSSAMGDKKILSTRQVRPAEMDRWRSVLSREDVAALGDALGGDNVARFGYPELAEELVNCWGVGRVGKSEILLRPAIQSFVGSETPLLENAQRELLRVSAALAASDKDRADRLELIKSLQRELGELRQHLDEVEADRAARLELIKSLQRELGELRQHLDEVEADRAARLELIKSLQRELGELRQHLDEVEADRAARLELIRSLQKEQNELRQWIARARGSRWLRLGAKLGLADMNHTSDR